MKLTHAFMGLDIETIPDFELLQLKKPETEGRPLVELEESFYQMTKNSKTGEPEFPRNIWHRPISLSMVIWEREKGFSVRSAGPEQSEKEIVQSFLDVLDEHGGPDHMRVFTFNGSQFDLSVLRLRCLKYRLDASTFLDFGEKNPNARWSSYANRYNQAHIDILDFMRNFFLSGQTGMSLQEVSLLCGLPGKIGIGGQEVYTAYTDKRYQEIQQYCDVDALLACLLGYDILRICHGQIPRYRNFKNDFIEFANSDFADHRGFKEFFDRFDIESWLKK